MPNCCSVVNCRTGYKLTKPDREKDCMHCTSETCKCVKFQCVCKAAKCNCDCKVCKPKLFSFPKDPLELENWLRACPNILPEGHKMQMACEWHWPEGYETVPPAKNPHICSDKPKHPPSIFNDIPPSCSRVGLSKPRPTSRALTEARAPSCDELEEFESFDIINSFDDFRSKSKSECYDHYLDQENVVCVYNGMLHKMNYCLIVQRDLSFEMYVRGVQVQNILRIKILKRMSQFSELWRQLKQSYEDLDSKMANFNDRQNELLVTHQKGRRYNVNDISMALDLVCISRAAYKRLNSYLPLPSIRTLQNLFASSENISICDIIKELSPMQKYIHLNIDEIYVKPSLRFTGGTVYGNACDNPNELAKTILVLMANCDFGGPKFVAGLRPVFRLDAAFQKKVVLEIIDKLEKAGGHVFCCTFDGNAVNTKMVTSLPGLVPSSTFLTVRGDRRTFWLNDPVHLLKCIRNNFLNASELLFIPPEETEVKTAKWSDLVKLFEFETSNSQSVKQSRLNKMSVNPSHISRQRVDLTLRVFCPETAAALQTFGAHETATFVSLVSDFFTIMNTKSPEAAKKLKNPLRKPITRTETSVLQTLNSFAKMIKNMKPQHSRRRPSEKTLSMDTAKAIVAAIEGFCEMANYLLDNGYLYVVLGRYTNDHIEKLFGKWRQASGSNYFISVADVIHTQRIQWSKVANQFLGLAGQGSSSSHRCDLCDVTPNEDNYFKFLMDTDVVQADHLLGACVYIAGYLCHQVPSLPSIHRHDAAIDEKKEFEFLHILDRGGLKYPDPSVISFVYNCHNYFENLSIDDKRCRNYLIKCFEMIDELYDTQVTDTRAYRCLANILLNNYCKTTNLSRPLPRKLQKLSETGQQ